MKSPLKYVLMAVSVGLAIQAVSGLPSWRIAPLTPPSYPVKTLRSRGTLFETRPYWASTTWSPNDDYRFKLIEDEVRAAKLEPLNSDRNGYWLGKVRRAYSEWHADPLNDEKLFRASTYLATLGMLDFRSRESEECKAMKEMLREGYVNLTYDPTSYIFSRRAYISTSDTSHRHLFGKLAVKLLERRPIDRAVTIAMLQEHLNQNRDEAFVQALFQALSLLLESEDMVFWDERYMAEALRIYGRRHDKRSYYDKAIAYVDKAIAGTPKGVDPKSILDYRAILSEKADPLYGLQSRPDYSKTTGN